MCSLNKLDPRKLRWSAKVGLGLLLSIMLLPTFAAPKAVIIGIVSDGPSTKLDQAIEAIEVEIKALTAGEFEVSLPQAKRIQGNWQRGKIKAAFATLYDDPQVDIVIALGFSTATIAVGLERYPKPTLAAMILDERLSNTPRKGISSGINNLAYISIQADLESEIKTFRRVTNFSKVAILIDALMSEVMLNFRAEGRRISGELDLQLIPLLHDGQSDFLSQLPQDVDAVMIGALPRLNDAQHLALLKELTDRGLPSYSLLGSELVEMGALVTALPAQNWQRRIRRLALQVQGVLLGENPRDMKVAIESKRSLLINMQTARELGVSPPFDVLLEAQTLNEDNQSLDIQLWTLNQVAQTVIKDNLGVRASKLELAAGAKDVDQVRAILLPQLSLSVDQSLNNDDNTSVISGAIAENNGSASLNLDQIIYNESARANLDIQRAQQDALQATTHKTLLDAVQDASVAFLDTLNALSQRDVSRETLDLSRSNLDLAQDKANAGSASNADVYRWQSEVADAKTDLLDADAALIQAKEDLNQLLGRPLDEAFRLQAASLDDPALIISDPQMVDLIENEAQYKRLERSLLENGLIASPEIAALRAELSAQERSLKSNRRARYSPTLSLNSSVSNTYEDNRSGQASKRGKDDWRVGLSLSLTLFEGGAIKQRIAEDSLKLDQLRLELADTSRQVEQNIRAQLHQTRASKLSIDLRRASAIATAKNLNLVADAYSQGEAGVIDLIDAQNSATNANLSEAQSVYQFLIDLMNLQRASGTFDFFLDEAQRQARIRSIKSDVSGE